MVRDPFLFETSFSTYITNSFAFGFRVDFLTEGVDVVEGVVLLLALLLGVLGVPFGGGTPSGLGVGVVLLVVDAWSLLESCR